jgi:ABC-type phosphate/phosphonate transport system ATPase subunit
MEGVAVAVIGAVGVVLSALIQSLRKENRRDHGVVATKLDQLVQGHERIENKIDGHIGDHARGEV